MAKMIPPFYDEKIKSNGEKKLFHVLEKLDEDYVILHSLGLSQHESKVFGEIDYVIICEQGILCLEVKGGQVFRENGVWYFVDRYGRESSKVEGPFMQAHSATLSLRNYLRKQFGTGDQISQALFAWGVVFPDVPFTQKGPDIVPDVIFDARCSSDLFKEYIDRVFEYWRNELKAKHGFTCNNLAQPQVARLENFLRGDFGFVPSLGYMVDQTSERLIALTQEQLNRLAMARDNPRVLLKGSAGTGKTVISIEHARRMAAIGKKVLYLCYNQGLCRHLQESVKVKGLEGSLVIDTFHGLISDILKKINFLPQKVEDEDYYYRHILPQSLIDCVSSGIRFEQYDAILVDEGQDLLTLNYIACLDALLLKGLAKGNWHICFDPNQNLYNKDFEDGLELILEYNPTVLTLDTNCRNTRPIGIYTTLLSAMPPARFFRVNGDNVLREGYKDFTDERQKVLKLVKKLLGQGIKPGSICLLSRYKYSNSCLQGGNLFQGICKFQNITHLDPRLQINDGIRFSTIHSFKGLEAKVVLLLDVEGFSSMSERLMNYTAMSRAMSLLYVFYNLDCESELSSIMSKSSTLLEFVACE